MDDVTWGALALTLTVLGADLDLGRLPAARRWRSGLRAPAFTLLPIAAYLTRTLRMFTRIAEAVADWATSLVFNPSVWIGIVLAGVSVALFVVVRASCGRAAREPRAGPQAAPRRAGRGARAAGEPAAPPAAARGEPAIDDDMAEIEALLRRRGIE